MLQLIQVLKGQGIHGSVKGNASFDKSSNTLKLDFDKIDLISTIDSKPVNISLNGFYSFAPLEKPIDEPSGEKLELFKLSQEKAVQIAQEIQKNAEGLASIIK